MDWLDLLAVQGTLKSLLQHHSSKASRCLLHLDPGNMKVNKTSPLPLVQTWGPNSSFWEKETARIPQAISLDHGLRWQRAGEDEELKNIKVSVVCSGADLGSLKTALNIHNNCHYNDNGYMCVLSSSGVQLFATPWTATNQAPLSMGFSRQGGVGCCFLPRNLLNPGIEPALPATPMLAGRFFATEAPGKPGMIIVNDY